MTLPLSLDHAPGEQIALAIRHAMQDNLEPFRGVMSYLRDDLDWTDEQIGMAFMFIGSLIFNEQLHKDLENAANGVFETNEGEENETTSDRS